MDAGASGQSCAGPLARRLKVMLVQMGQQNATRTARAAHFLVYAGFIVLFIGTLMVAVHEDLGIHFLAQRFSVSLVLVDSERLWSPVHDRGLGLTYRRCLVSNRQGSITVRI